MTYRVIRELKSRDELPQSGKLSNLELRFPKLEFNLPCGGYVKQDTNPTMITRETYSLDLPMLEEIKIQGKGTHLESYLSNYTGTTGSSWSYALIDDKLVNYYYAYEEGDKKDELFLGRMTWLFIDNTILRVGRVIRVVDMLCNLENRIALESILNGTGTFIPNFVFDRCEGKWVRAYMACDFIDVEADLDRGCLYAWSLHPERIRLQDGRLRRRRRRQSIWNKVRLIC